MTDSISLDGIDLLGFEVRKARPLDSKQISLVEKDAQPAPWSEKVFRNEFNVKVSNIWVVEKDHLIVAFIVFWVVHDEIHILNVAVHSLHRRLGIAAAMISELKKEAQRTRKTVISLEVRASNQGAQLLYGSFAFKKIALRKGYYNDNLEDAIVLACVIEEPTVEET